MTTNHYEEKTRLTGNSELGPRQLDPVTGVLVGFDIKNPDGSKLHVDLRDYGRPQETDHSAGRLRETVYQTYDFLARNVPAATPVFESIAREFPRGMIWVKPEKNGLWNEISPGKGDDPGDPGRDPVQLTGNLRLPRGNDAIATGGGAMHSDAAAQDYLGKDGKWHSQLPAEALLHELVHSTRELQNWRSVEAEAAFLSQQGRSVPVENLKELIRLENEARAIELVNQSMLAPLGVGERDPSAYRINKPASVAPLPRSDYATEDTEKLRHAGVPEELASYSRPNIEPLLTPEHCAAILDRIRINIYNAASQQGAAVDQFPSLQECSR